MRPGAPRLNLLPPWVRRRGWTKWAILVVAIALGIEVAVIMSIDVNWSRRITQLREEKTQLEQKKQEIQNILNEAQRIRDGVKAIDERLTMLDGILKTGKLWVDACQKLARWIPAGVQITSLQFAGTTVMLEGFARDRKTWEQFWDVISRSEFFTNVNLLRLSLNEPFGITLTSGAPAQGTLPGITPPTGGPPTGMPQMPGMMPGMMPQPGQPSPTAAPVSRWRDYMPIGAVEFAIQATLSVQIQIPSFAPQVAAPPGMAPGGMPPAGMPPAGGPPGAPPESAAGPPPESAAGPPPESAAGPPPESAAGGPPASQ
jgi:Tfp pilus assembly protein PilN